MQRKCVVLELELVLLAPERRVVDDAVELAAYLNESEYKFQLIKSVADGT